VRLPNYQIKKQIKARLIRKYRGGLLKKKTKAESVFEEILKKLDIDFIPQAGFFTDKSFYIVDFYIKSPYKLIIEVDDASHKTKERYLYNKAKISYLRKCGFRVLTFTNDMVLNQRLKVERQVFDCLDKIRRSQKYRIARHKLIHKASKTH
jgi:very-short-patch-repair endonuclease